ncbi:hypothetical protein SAMN05443252_10972 [Bacillus sp. OV322]|nr:hypothetical protein SAMN05443252_10972 [Bacillus sp. OV322]
MKGDIFVRDIELMEIQADVLFKKALFLKIVVFFICNGGVPIVKSG